MACLTYSIICDLIIDGADCGKIYKNVTGTLPRRQWNWFLSEQAPEYDANDAARPPLQSPGWDSLPQLVVAGERHKNALVQDPRALEVEEMALHLLYVAPTRPRFSLLFPWLTWSRDFPLANVRPEFSVGASPALH